MKIPDKFEFNAIIKKHSNMNASYIEFPYDPIECFGKKNRIKVVAYFNGYKYRGMLVSMGDNCLWIGINQEIRKIIGKNPGDEIQVIIMTDSEDRIAEIPVELQNAFKKFPDAEKVFKNLSYTYQREYSQWIITAKKEDTKKRRVEKCLALLMEKTKQPREKK